VGLHPVLLRAFGDDVLRVAEQRGVSLREAARQAGVPANTLSRLTRYADSVSLENFARLCRWGALIADSYIAR
jgi:transcriptional regulator with XRE-family HTH domain